MVDSLKKYKKLARKAWSLSREIDFIFLIIFSVKMNILIKKEKIKSYYFIKNRARYFL